MKKVLSIISAVVVIAVLTLNVSLSKDSKTDNLNLAGISAAPEASAECSFRFGGASGHCSWDGTMCFYDPSGTTCNN